jgi:HPr kinase/phosphorylase
MFQLHATCVAIANQGVLICGPSGSGKSDLALRLIDDGAILVADDRVDVCGEDGQLRATVPDAIKGLIEVRGLGVYEVPHITEVTITLVVELRDSHLIERLPEASSVDVDGVPVKEVKLNAFENATPAKIRLAMERDVLAPEITLTANS